MDPYRPPKNLSQRVFKTPLISVLLVFLVIALFLGFWILKANQRSLALVDVLADKAFIVCLLSYLAYTLLAITNASNIRRFLKSTPAITNPDDLARLKPVIRTNMYSALLTMVLLILITVLTIVVLLGEQLLESILVMLCSIVVTVLLYGYGQLEQRLKQIPIVSDNSESELAKETERLLTCWVEKLLPDF
ncbi:MAG: hypothetical protein HWE13_04840 [Gammaproteobacteria bacterium]|nr:hypothetical protein [Gammaproteobacteria bacterium]